MNQKENVIMKKTEWDKLSDKMPMNSTLENVKKLVPKYWDKVSVIILLKQSVIATHLGISLTDIEVLFKEYIYNAIDHKYTFNFEGDKITCHLGFSHAPHEDLERGVYCLGHEGYIPISTGSAVKMHIEAEKTEKGHKGIYYFTYED